MEFVTILDLAKYRGVIAEPDGGIRMSEFARVGLEMLGGCEVCNASLSAGNAYPSRSGYWRCREHIGNLGWTSAEEANRSIFERGGIS